ncbi:MAG: hypothetical protein FWE37_09490 [Spirochaetaceae bacterium]|nr:hypothetical protein [Spirochaetaceae bacterium]
MKVLSKMFVVLGLIVLMACNPKGNESSNNNTNGLSARALAMRAAVIERFEGEGVTARMGRNLTRDAGLNLSQVHDSFGTPMKRVLFCF